MRRIATLLMLALLLTAPAARAADVFLLGFSGFDFESPDQSDPDPTPVTYLQIGDGYRALGDITNFGPLLQPVVNTVTNEYTYHLFGLTVLSHDFGGTLLVVKFANDGQGRMRHYENQKAPSGTHRDFGTNPPNATAPSTFVDGVLMLGGLVFDAQLTYNYAAPGQGNFNAKVTYDEGSQLSALGGQTSGWILSGAAGPPNETIPAGYDHQLNGEVRLDTTVPATHRTWGAIKAIYR